MPLAILNKEITDKLFHIHIIKDSIKQHSYNKQHLSPIPFMLDTRYIRYKPELVTSLKESLLD